MTIRRELIDELLKEYPNPQDILAGDGLLKELTKAVIERCLETELDTHLGYPKHGRQGHATGQSRPLEPVYPIIYVDCLVVKVRENQRVLNKSVYLVLAVDLNGQKELLGMWIAQTEGAKFWLGVLTELQNRGVKDLFIACVDGLTGLPGAIETVYPQTRVQVCMVHLMRNSLRYVSYKHMKSVVPDLKPLYSAATA